MSASQRRKGAAFERENVLAFREALPGVDVKRGFQSRSGEEVPDVDADPFWIECKVGKLPNPRAALKQAQGDAKPGRIPVAVIKDDRCAPFVVLSRADFLELVQQWWRDRR